MCVCVCTARSREKSKTALRGEEWKLGELILRHLPNDHVGRGYFGQREHSVQRNAASAPVAPPKRSSLMVWGYRIPVASSFPA